MAKKHTVSELRTLKTKYSQALKEVTDIFDAIKMLELTYSGAQSRERTKDPGEQMRITGIRQCLKIAAGKKEQIEAQFSNLRTEYKSAPKYTRKGKGVIKQTTVEANGESVVLNTDTADVLHRQGFIGLCDDPSCSNYHPAADKTLGDVLTRVKEVEGEITSEVAV